MKIWRSLILVVCACRFFAAPLDALAQSLSQDFYSIGSPVLTEYYVDPQQGNDSNNGLSRAQPKKTVSSVWNGLRQNQEIESGVRINLLPGEYGANHLPNYWENRVGTYSKPVIMRAIDGFGTVTFTRDINMAGVSYFYLIGVTIQNKTTDGYGDAFHCERCDHVLLRGNSFNGAPSGRSAGGDIAHETIKFNQSQYVYIENNNIQGADDNGIDWVAVQYGYIRGNRIHDTNGWCAYAKGGSSYTLIESNQVYDCGEGGITAGQGTGFEFMVSPWIRFEANYIKIVNNVIHDVEGAALGVNGGYGILLAHNTAYQIGSRSHLLEIVFGERSCDGDTATCTALRGLGGWGPAQTGSDHNQPIGNQDIIVSNNIFYNPSGFSSGSQHFAIYGPRTPSATGIPSPQRSDTGLKITGNLVWNGSGSMPVGIEDTDQGCQSGNATCTLSQILSTNLINSTEPNFINASQSDFRPTASGSLAGIVAAAISDIPTIDSTLNPISEGVTSNQMVREFSGATASTRPPGALVGASSSVSFPSPSDSGGGTPDPEDPNDAPVISQLKVTVTRNKKKVNVSFQAKISDADGISSNTATIIAAKKEVAAFALTRAGAKYKGKRSIKTKAKKITARIVATDTLGMSATKKVSVNIPLTNRISVFTSIASGERYMRGGAEPAIHILSAKNRVAREGG